MSLADRLAKASQRDRIMEIRMRVQERLVEVLGPRLYDASMSDTELEGLVHQRLRELLDEEEPGLSAQEKLLIVRQIGDSVLGLGPLEPFVRDPEVTEIMANGWDSIYVERAGKLYWTGAKFHDDAQLRRTIDKIVSKVGRRIDESSPFCDARLPDGSRVNAIIPPLAVDGPALTIRKFAADPYQAEDLVGFGTLSRQVVQLLEACVRGRTNILVSGGTGAGKTTTLNVLSSFLPDDERIVTHRGRRRAAPPAAARRASGGPPAEHRGQGRGDDPRSGPQLPAHAPGPHRRRRGPRRRGAGHDAGHEHGPRRLDQHDPLQLAPRRARAPRDDVHDVGDGPRDPRDPRADRLGAEPDHPPVPDEGRQPPRDPRDGDRRDGGRRDHPPGPVPVRLRRRGGLGGQVPREPEGHRPAAALHREDAGARHRGRRRGVRARPGGRAA